MENFMKYNFDISSIVVSCLVTKENVTPMHKNRASHGIVFYLDGLSEFNFDDLSLKISSNTFLYLPKGSDYTATSLSSSHNCYAINFQLFNEISFTPFKMKTKNPSNFLKLFQDSERAWRTRESGYEMKVKSILYNILFDIRKEYELGYISKSKRDLIQPAIDFIHKEYTNDNIEISYLSNLCDMSEAYFRRIFLKVFGTSPIKYINNLKIERAKELISSDIYSITDAAYASGFHNISYFSRTFKETTGLSPSKYAENKTNFAEDYNKFSF